MAAQISRPDSLVAELTRRGLFEEFSQWCFVERPTLATMQGWLEDRAIERSLDSISAARRSPEWRMAHATFERDRLAKCLPMELDSTLRASLLDQRFNAALGELTHKELMDHLSIQLEEAKLQLKQKQVSQKDEEIALSTKKFQRETAKLFLEWNEDERAKAIAGSSATNAEKIEQLGRAMFDDWDEA